MSKSLITDKQIVDKLKEIGEGNYLILDLFAGKYRDTRENDEMHLRTFISAIRKGKLKSFSQEKGKYIVSFVDDVVTQWEIIPAVKYIVSDYKDRRVNRVANGFITKGQARDILADVQCSSLIDHVDIIERVDLIDKGYEQFILKDKLENVISIVNNHYDTETITKVKIDRLAG